ncbi:MAG: Tim44-like domain-containing protein [Xanthobacteraceae bacterium]
MRLLKFRPLLAVLALVAGVALVASIADARPRSSFGSRGSQTFSAPPSTATAPKATRPMERSMTQPGQPGSTASRTATAPNAAGGGFFNRPGFMGGLFAGFLGAGLLGMLMGNGFAGGLGGMASILGLLLQIGIIALIGYLLWTWWQRRSQPAMASGPMLRDYGGNDSGRRMGIGGGMGALGGGFGSGAPAQRAAGTDDVGLTPDDFNTFEQTLGEVQTAYGKEDLSALRSRVTPEMLSYYSEELAANASRGVVNRISDIKLEQGDLAEAWREGNTDYATVAMRYSLNDTVVDQNGRVLEGGPDEATEVWTFRRDGGGKWLVSAVQQTA